MVLLANRLTFGQHVGVTYPMPGMVLSTLHTLKIINMLGVTYNARYGANHFQLLKKFYIQNSSMR